MKLPNNSLIEIHGWVMLKEVEGGKRYLIQHGRNNGENIYWFCNPRSKKQKIGHYASDVDCWVHPPEHPNLNKIVMVA